MTLLSASNFLALGIFTWVLISLIRRTTSGPLPPGPQRMPVIGNLLDMPKEREWVTWAEWGKRYGVPHRPLKLSQIFHTYDRRNIFSGCVGTDNHCLEFIQCRQGTTQQSFWYAFTYLR